MTLGWAVVAIVVLMALVAVVVSALLLAGLTEINASYYPIVLLVAGAAAALGVLRLRKRTHGWVLIAAIAGAYTVAGLSVGLLDSLPLRIPAEITRSGHGGSSRSDCCGSRCSRLARKRGLPSTYFCFGSNRLVS